MTVGSKLALHSPFTHADARDWQVIDEWQPRSVKLFNDSYTSRDRMEWFYRELPGTVMVMRDWELSEQRADMWRDPVATGVRHANDWIAWRNVGRFGQQAWNSINGFANSRTVCLGINEPSVEHDLDRGNPNYAANVQKCVQYTVAFLDTLRGAGMRGGALNLSVGFPDNTGHATRVDWERWTPVRDAIARGNHFLVLHEYWANNGPQENMGWWFDRLGQCPWDVPIILGEFGYDKGVRPGWQPPRGWAGNLTKDQYLQQLAWADAYYKRDRRVHSMQVYQYDYANNEWASFGLREMREELSGYIRTVRSIPDTATLTFPRYPAGVINPLPGGETPPPVPSPVRWDKVCWNFEEVARRLQREGYQSSHDWVLSSTSYREAIRNRDAA